MSHDKEKEVLDLIMDLVRYARQNKKSRYDETKKEIRKLKKNPEYKEIVTKMMRALRG